MSDAAGMLDRGHFIQVEISQERYESLAMPCVSSCIGASSSLSGSLNGSPDREGIIVVDRPR